jgi:hypothetical protein
MASRNRGRMTLPCMTVLHDEFRPGRRVDLAVEPILNEFNGRSNVELEVKDLRFCP